MSGKQAKREVKRLKEAQRQAARQRQRQQTLWTIAVIGLIVALGAVLVFVSLEPTEEAADDVASEGPTPAPTEDERAVACGAEVPSAATGDRTPFTESQAIELDAAADYSAVFETSCGTVTIDLYEDRAPQTVAHFAGLTEQGFYDGLEIFRNAPSIFALQSGAGTNENTWQLGYTVPDELEAAEAEGYTPGSLAMANSGQPDSGGSQFFFTYGEAGLPPSYTKFGQVVEGLDVLETIGAIPVDGERPTELIYIESITIRADPKES